MTVQPREPLSRSHPPAARRAARGAFFGALLGSAFIAIGAMRAAFFLLGGGRIEALTAADVRPFVFYLAGFAAAGTLVGATWPMIRSRIATYAVFGAGGALVMIAIMAGDAGGLAARDGFDWVVLPLVGVLFGCAFARGWLGRGR